ncbi:MAG: radical SAM protein [Candidatus Bathyarchaeota archaeon]|nr:radical SAM protein [Candidatus Bathyarchaeota archaeon]
MEKPKQPGFFPDDRLAKKSLARYFAIVSNKKRAKFLLAKKVPTESGSDDSSLDALWKKHEKATDAFLDFEHQVDAGVDFDAVVLPKESYLDLKVKIATKTLECCNFCSRRCGVNRLAHRLGFCGCGNMMSVSSIFMHLGEEPELVPSGTVFTMGCTIRCKHCQNWTISQWKEAPMEYKPAELAREVENLRLEGCRNVNLVGGEPTPWLAHWLQTFQHVGVNVPVVWNSNSYYSPETARLLAGFADVYLLDFKYGPGDCALRISDAPNYWQICTRNHLEAKRYGELLVRVLVLPGHLDCCVKPIVNWIAENLGVETRVNVMFQYRPAWRASEVPELRRRLTQAEMDKALRLAEQAGLVNLVS